MTPITDPQVIKALTDAGGQLWEKQGKRRIWLSQVVLLNLIDATPRWWVGFDSGEKHLLKLTIGETILWDEDVAGTVWKRIGLDLDSGEWLPTMSKALAEIALPILNSILTNPEAASRAKAKESERQAQIAVAAAAPKKHRLNAGRVRDVNSADEIRKIVDSSRGWWKVPQLLEKAEFPLDVFVAFTKSENYTENVAVNFAKGKNPAITSWLANHNPSRDVRDALSATGTLPLMKLLDLHDGHLNRDLFHHPDMNDAVLATMAKRQLVRETLREWLHLDIYGSRSRVGRATFTVLKDKAASDDDLAALMKCYFDYITCWDLAEVIQHPQAGHKTLQVVMSYPQVSNETLADIIHMANTTVANKAKRILLKRGVEPSVLIQELATYRSLSLTLSLKLTADKVGDPDSLAQISQYLTSEFSRVKGEYSADADRVFREKLNLMRQTRIACEETVASNRLLIGALTVGEDGVSLKGCRTIQARYDNVRNDLRTLHERSIAAISELHTLESWLERIASDHAGPLG